MVTRIVDIPIDRRTRDVVVRQLVDWGYLGANRCINEDEPDCWETLGAAIAARCRGYCSRRTSDVDKTAGLFRRRAARARPAAPVRGHRCRLARPDRLR